MFAIWDIANQPITNQYPLFIVFVTMVTVPLTTCQLCYWRQCLVIMQDTCTPLASQEQCAITALWPVLLGVNY